MSAMPTTFVGYYSGCGCSSPKTPDCWQW